MGDGIEVTLFALYGGFAIAASIAMFRLLFSDSGEKVKKKSKKQMIADLTELDGRIKDLKIMIGDVGSSYDSELINLRHRVIVLEKLLRLKRDPAPIEAEHSFDAKIFLGDYSSSAKFLSPESGDLIAYNLILENFDEDGR